MMGANAGGSMLSLPKVVIANAIVIK